MKRILLVYTIFIFAISAANASNIMLKTNDISAELRIDTPAKYYKSHNISDNTIEIFFNKPISVNLSNDFSNEFISDIFAEKTRIIIKTTKDTSSYVTLDSGINVIIVKSQKVKNLSISSQIEGPFIKNSDKIEKDPEAENKLMALRNLADKQQYSKAITEINSFISEHKNDIYGQEAYFLLGEIYMEMGKINPKHYLQASSIFEDYARKFTESYQYPDALWNAAISKEKAGLYDEALYSYRSIYTLLPDSNLGLDALDRMGEIYKKIWQTDKAIETYEEYLNKSGDEDVTILGKIGSLYEQQKNYDKAYIYFQRLMDNIKDYSVIDPQILHSLAQTLEHKDKIESAIEIYNKIFNLHPQHKLADSAMYSAAFLQEKLGNTNIANELYLLCKQRYPDKLGGIKSAIRYVKLHLDDNTTEYWQSFLNNALNTNQDLYLKAEAYYLIIKSFFRETRYDEALQTIRNFEQTFFDSPFLNNVYDIEQQIYLKRAENYFNENMLNQSEKTIKSLLQSFPETKYYDNAQKLLENIEIKRAEQLFENGDARETIKKAESYIGNNKKLYEKEKWFNLLDKAYYKLIDELSSAGNSQEVIMNAKAYYNYVENGDNKAKITEHFKSALLDVMSEMMNKENYINILSMYSTNSQKIDQWETSPAKDSIYSYVAYALYKLEENDKSAKMLNKITTQTPEVKMMKILLNKEVNNFDVNELESNRFDFFIKELAERNPLSAYDYAKKYTKSTKKSLQASYNVVNAVEGNQYTILVNSLYNDTRNISKNNLENIAEFFLDAGELFYNNNNYSKAEESLNKYMSFENIDNKPKAMYLLAKINTDNNNIRKARELLQQIVEEYPDNFYARMAADQLEDANWKENLKNR